MSKIQKRTSARGRRKNNKTQTKQQALLGVFTPVATVVRARKQNGRAAVEVIDAGGRLGIVGTVLTFGDERSAMAFLDMA